MVFDIKGKVALITGGASGIGLQYAKELLRNGAKAVTLADANPEFGAEALKGIEEEFGNGKAIFVLTDVTKVQDFEDAFLKTVEEFKYIDILINNAGILNDNIWEKQININLNGTVHGINLALHKYLPNHSQGDERLIINISSLASFIPLGFVPVYASTKLAIAGLTRNFGIEEIYQKTKVRVIAICPGVTWTPLIKTLDSSKIFHEQYEDMLEEHNRVAIGQDPEFLAKEAMRVIKYAPNGTVWIVAQGHPAYEYVFPEFSTLKSNVLKEV